MEQSIQEKAAWERQEKGQEARGRATKAWRAGRWRPGWLRSLCANRRDQLLTIRTRLHYLLSLDLGYFPHLEPEFHFTVWDKMEIITIPPLRVAGRMG